MRGRREDVRKNHRQQRTDNDLRVKLDLGQQRKCGGKVQKVMSFSKESKKRGKTNIFKLIENLPIHALASEKKTFLTMSKWGVGV